MSSQIVARAEELIAEQPNTNHVDPESDHVTPPTAPPSSTDAQAQPTLRRSSRKRKAPADHDEPSTQANAARSTTAGRKRRRAAAALDLDINNNEDAIPATQQPNAPLLNFPLPNTDPTPPPPRPVPGRSIRPDAPYQLPLDDEENNITSGTPMPEMHPHANGVHHPTYLQGLEQPEMLSMPPRKPHMMDSMRRADAARASRSGKGKRAKVGRPGKK